MMNFALVGIYGFIWCVCGILLCNVKSLEIIVGGWIDECHSSKHNWLIPFMIVFIPLLMALACAFVVCRGPMLKFVSFLKTPFKGEFGMKWFLFRSLFLVAFGFTASETQMVSKAWQWWSAPPPPPSAEAQKLIASLRSAEGWVVCKLEGKSYPRLKRGNVLVKPDNIWADVYVNDTDCNGQFTVNDLKAVNSAAEVCLRKLATQAMGETVADSR